VGPESRPLTFGAELEMAPERRWDPLRRFARNRLAVVGGIVLTLMLSVAVFAQFLAPSDPLAQDFNHSLEPPSREHPCGTDELGRDICSRVMYGGRASLAAGFLAVLVGGSVGTMLGLTAGYFGGWVDRTVMRGLDVVFALPAILLAIVIVTMLGPSLTNAILAVAIVNIPPTARVVRAEVLTITPRAYILACRVIGARDSRIVVKHILPNAMAPLIVQLTVGLAFAILSTAALGFLGLGAQPPMPEWGNMISGARAFLFTRFEISVFPGVAILLTTVSLNLVGDGLQDALNPKLIV
jgi:peptide/nickel transport system permease protein